MSELKIATYLEPPFVDLVDNKFVGEDITLVKALAGAVHLEPVFILCPFVRCEALVKTGKADMIISVRKTSIRMKDMIFLKPAIFIQKKPIRFYLNKDSNLKVDSYKDLNGLVIGTVRGSTYYDEFDQDASLVKVQTTNRQQLLGMLAANRIDTFLEREELIIPLMSGGSYINKFKLAMYKYEKSVEGFIAISKYSKIADYGAKLSNELAKILAGKNKEIILNDRKTDY